MAQTTLQQNDSITDLFTYLKWPSLEDQRKDSLLLKIVRKLFIVPNCCFQAFAQIEGTHSHHSLKLGHKNHRR